MCIYVSSLIESRKYVDCLFQMANSGPLGVFFIYIPVYAVHSTQFLDSPSLAVSISVEQRQTLSGIWTFTLIVSRKVGSNTHLIDLAQR